MNVPGLVALVWVVTFVPFQVTPDPDCHPSHQESPCASSSFSSSCELGLVEEEGKDGLVRLASPGEETGAGVGAPPPAHHHPALSHLHSPHVCTPVLHTPAVVRQNKALHKMYSPVLFL